MICPVCGEKLREVEKFGVQVDICPGCKGVWLDRGELEKILAMAEAGGPAQQQAPPQQYREEPRPRQEEYRPRKEPRYREHDEHHSREHDEHRSHGGYSGHKRRGSWLGEILGGLGGDD